MISKLNLENILFLDIETVPETQHFSDLDETKQALWQHKSQYQRKEEFTAEEFYDRAGIWAEFGKIVCISVGYFNILNDLRTFRTTSFYGDEIKILKDFIKSEIEDSFDHKNLNIDVPEFKNLNPTAENIVVVIYDKLKAVLDSNLALEVTLFETPRNFVSYSGL